MKSIFLDQLPFDTTEEDVRPLFEPFGVVHSVIIGSDRDLGQIKCFALIELEQTSQEDPIEALQELTIRGETLQARLAPQGHYDRRPSPSDHTGGSA